MRRMTTVPVDSGTQVHINTSDIPAHVATNLAQAVFEAIHREYADPEVQADYQRWKAERERSRVEMTTV